MEQLFNTINNQSGNFDMIKSKIFLRKNILKLSAIIYGVWFVISLILASSRPEKYAAYFTDLPQYLKAVPSFVLSIIYLDLFIPAIMLVIFYALYILFFVIRNAFKK
jgi:hypothetical protein